jgi:hypothetical protein
MEAKLKALDREAGELAAFISAESARQDIERLRNDAASASQCPGRKRRPSICS